MMYVCLILFAAIAILWFVSYEYPGLFGVFMPACAMRKTVFRSVVAVLLLVSVLFSGVSDTAYSIRTHFAFSDLDCQSLMVILLAGLMTLLLLRVFSVTGSAVYALWGAFEAYGLSCGEMVGDSWLYVAAVIAAPLMAFAVSFAVRWLMKITVCKAHIHLIVLSHYMRIAVLAALLLTVVALGFNWGGFLLGCGSLASSPAHALPSVAAVLAAGLLSSDPLSRHAGYDDSGIYQGFSMYNVLSVGLATGAVLMFFSFDASAGMIGLKAAPLATGSLVFASVAGSDMAQKTAMLDRDDYLKEIAAFAVTPVGAFLISYILFYVLGLSEDGDMVKYAALTAAVLVIVSLMFAAYARKVRMSREATERLVYSQQQQIYENSRALNDMELKVVLSENQALHNAVEMKRQEVMNVALGIVEQKEYLESLSALVKKLSVSKDEAERDRLVSELDKSLKQRLSYDRDVDSQYFYAQAETLHEDFSAKLSENFPNLTQQERRLATLLRLGFSSKYIATLMNITPKSVEISRYRLRQKLGLSKGDNLVNFIKSI
ncbi:MAG: helix-turn-helix domain-containing protein [Bacteroidales bacterium]|nr:helix-turn-helix domain-containing protein [Bacteroidales bacterium]